MTLLGSRLPGRLSSSSLTTLGLTDLITYSLNEYVGRAARLAGERDWLARELATLRERLMASPFLDVNLYTRAAEDAYRTLWRRWCAQATAR